MNSTITITDVANINFETMSVVDYDQVLTETHDSHMDVFLFENESGNQRRANLMSVSVYDDMIVRDDKKFKILHMLSK